MGPKRTGGIPDYTDYTCTSLMIHLKLQLRKVSSEEAVEFIIRRDQKETVEGPFSDDGYNLTFKELDVSRIYVCMQKVQRIGELH